MYGSVVNQDGLIRSVTAIQRGGHVELFASNAINTGPGSLIDVPASTSSDTIISTSTTAQSSVTFSGLDPNNPANPTVYPSLIVHQGAIVAPSGLVTMKATDRVYLAPGSLIDVSGLWLDEPADAGLVQVQMNTANLRDNYSQKGGVLQGQTIKINQVAGSAIGDIAGVFTTQATTAAERHTAGGEVDIKVTGSSTGTVGAIVMMQGATVNFSGGGITYGAGALDTTMLVSGTKIYDISTANANATYDSILNSQTFTSSKFGVTREYDGVYYGGAFPVNKYVSQYRVGSNAGTLSRQAPTVVLDGTLLGQVTNGVQQTMAADPVNGTGNQSASGYIEATGGTLQIGAPGANDFVVQSITVSPETGPVLSTAFQPTDPLPSPNTVLSAATLNNAGLSSVSIAANATITVAKGTRINLNPGGAFGATARRIEDYGAITVPGGSISLTLATNTTIRGCLELHPPGRADLPCPRKLPHREWTEDRQYRRRGPFRHYRFGSPRGWAD
jgi:hypothetical protein